jgi:hypothetical protein
MWFLYSCRVFFLPSGSEEKQLGYVLDPGCQYFLFIPALILKIHEQLRKVQQDIAGLGNLVRVGYCSL